MILYENAADAIVRAGEFDLAGRRVTARAFPYTGSGGRAHSSFDPIERRFHFPAVDGSVSVGPHDPETWRQALSRNLYGNVAVAGGDRAEEIRGAYRAAAQGAAAAGRGVFLVDPPAAGLPEEPSDAFVLIFVTLPGGEPPDALGEALRRGFHAGLLLPLVPGWSCESDALEEILRLAEKLGARFLSPLPAAEDGPARRSAVEARGRLVPDLPEGFFERVHHGDWRGETEQARERMRKMCASIGLSCGVPRPVGRLEPTANAAAAGKLEEKADALFSLDEHHASLLHAAVRWIEESGRDLAPIVAEGNFRKIFPFAEDVAREAEAALREPQ